MLRLLTLNLQHGRPGVGAGDGAAATASLAGADITHPRTARAVLTALAEQIAELEPDVVALQEVDLGQRRSGYLDQAAEIAAALGWESCRFAATYAGPVAGLRRRPLRSGLEGPQDDVLGCVRAVSGRPPAGFGNALLTRLPVESWHVQRLGRGPATITRRPGRVLDPRSYTVATSTARLMLAATLRVPPGLLDDADVLPTLSVASVHLATRVPTAAAQLASSWRALGALPGPRVLAGDLNMRSGALADLGIARELGEGPTYPAGRPRHRIDHVLTDPWPTGPDGLPAGARDSAAAGGGTGDAAAPGTGCAPAPGGRHAQAQPLLRATGHGTRTFLVSDHAGTWVDLEPVR